MSKQPQTTKIRIAVAIDSNGDWQAFGASNCKNDKELMKGVFLDALLIGEQHYFVEADIPVHKINTIEGVVK